MCGRDENCVGRYDIMNSLLAELPEKIDVGEALRLGCVCAAVGRVRRHHYMCKLPSPWHVRNGVSKAKGSN